MRPEDREQLDHVVTIVEDVLGDVVGAYLFGSAVLGTLQDASDLDVLVVVRRPTTDAEKRGLVDRLLAISGRDGRRRVEVTVVVESDVKPWRYPASFDFQYGDWLRRDFERGDLDPWATKANPDLVTLIAMVLLTDTPLLGPPAAEVFDPFPPADLGRAVAESADGLIDDLDSDTRNVLLTLARIWSTLETGTIRSKDAAAAWAIERLPSAQRAPMAHARAAYLGEEDDRWDELAPELGPHVEYLLGEIARLKD